MRILKQDGSIFKVEGTHDIYTVDLRNLSCTCRDYVCRKRPAGLFCKHIKYVIKWVEENGI